MNYGNTMRFQSGMKVTSGGEDKAVKHFYQHVAVIIAVLCSPFARMGRQKFEMCLSRST